MMFLVSSKIYRTCIGLLKSQIKKCDVCGNVQCKLVSHLSHSSSKLLGIFYAQSFLLCWQNCTLQGHSSNNLFGQNIMKTFDLRIIWKSVKYRMQVTALIYMRTLHVHIDHCIQAVALVSSCTTRESFSSYKNNTISLSITCSTHYLILISLTGPGWIYLEIHEFDFKWIIYQTKLFRLLLDRYSYFWRVGNLFVP